MELAAAHWSWESLIPPSRLCHEGEQGVGGDDEDDFDELGLRLLLRCLFRLQISAYFSSLIPASPSQETVSRDSISSAIQTCRKTSALKQRRSKRIH